MTGNGTVRMFTLNCLLFAIFLLKQHFVGRCYPFSAGKWLSDLDDASVLKSFSKGWT
jgi:hypothetical protein